jgi:hypothetical protein
VKSVFAEMRVPSAEGEGWQDRVRDFANVHGFALAWVTGPSGRSDYQPGMLETFEALFEGHPDDGFPVRRRVFGALTEEEMHPNFEFGLDVLLARLRDVAGDRGERTGNPC